MNDDRSVDCREVVGSARKVLQVVLYRHKRSLLTITALVPGWISRIRHSSYCSRPGEARGRLSRVLATGLRHWKLVACYD